MNKINKIAKKITAFLKTKEVQVNNKISYAKELAQQIDFYFDSDNKLKQKYNEFEIKVYPYKFVQDYKDENKYYPIKIFMFYVDKINDKYKKYPIRKQYKEGMGQAISKSLKTQYIVMYGHSIKNGYGDISYFKSTFIHEMIHILDYCANNKERNQKDYFGHPLDGFKQNGGIPYPGINGKDDDKFDEMFAEYYTCKAERREYIYELLDFIEDYANRNRKSEQETVDLILKKMEDKNQFKKFIEKMKIGQYNYIALMFLYHLSFSQNKNGNKDDALNILNSLYSEE